MSCDNTIEIEINEDDIVAYLFNEKDDEIGFVIKDENGIEKEYYYETPIKHTKKKTKLDEEKQAVKETAQTMKDFYSESKTLIDDLKDIFVDIKKEVK